MDLPAGEKPSADLRDFLAEERTFLAWMRTGLALMGFGFVVARFGLFLAEIQVARAGPAAPARGFSPWFGRAFIAAGVAVILFAGRRHMRLVSELNRGIVTGGRSSQEAIILAWFLAMAGIGMVLYLTLA